jgi:membrane-bound serine protease (ClpP class)
VLLIDTDSPGYGIPLPLIGVLAVMSVAFVALVGAMAARARRRPVVTGAQTVLGAGGELLEFAGGEGWALVQGEHWKVRGPPQLQPGDRVRVTALGDGTLEIGPA